MSKKSVPDNVLCSYFDETGNEIQLIGRCVNRDYECIREYCYYLEERTPEGCLVMEISIGPREEVAKRLQRWIDIFNSGVAK